MAQNNFVKFTLNHKFPVFFTNKTERGFSGQSMEYSNVLSCYKKVAEMGCAECVAEMRHIPSIVPEILSLKLSSAPWT